MRKNYSFISRKNEYLLFKRVLKEKFLPSKEIDGFSEISLEKVLIVNPGDACGYLTGNATFIIIDTNKLEAVIIKL